MIYIFKCQFRGCGKEFSSKSPQAVYCPDCGKVSHGQRTKKSRSRRRYAAIMKHKNDSTYGKNKTVLLNYQWWAIVYDGHRNYTVIKKTKKEGGKDIWGIIRNAIKRRRCTYHTSLDSALRAIYDRIQSEPHVDRKHGFAKRILGLRNMITTTDFNGQRQSFDRMLLNQASKKGFGSDIFSLQNAIIDVKKELFEAVSEGSDKSLGRIDTDVCRTQNGGGYKQ